MFFTEFNELSDKKFMTLKGLEPATQQQNFAQFSEFRETDKSLKHESGSV